MARDEAEEEREFLAELKARSGQDLAGWMAAIATRGFADKNETIDWLRSQGFPFARASWLERIHSNGGRPIYLLDGRLNLAPVAPARPRIEPAPPPAVKKPQEAAPGDAARLEVLIAAAKGYRPLYTMLEAAIRRTIPDVAFSPRAQYIAVCAPAEFAAIAPGPADIRLGLDLGERPHDGTLQPARIRGAGADITHMLVLKDARQINAECLALVTAAHVRSAARAAPGP